MELAKENAASNGVTGVEFSGTALAKVEGTFDLVLANLFANTLVELAQPLAARTRHTLVLSGVLVPQAEEVARPFLDEGLRQAPTSSVGEWVRLVFERPNA